MTIHLSGDVENAINAAVYRGQLASVDDALAEAWRVYQHQSSRPQPAPGLGSIGAMRDAADELDEIVAEAVKRRGDEPRRDISVE